MFFPGPPPLCCLKILPFKHVDHEGLNTKGSNERLTFILFLYSRASVCSWLKNHNVNYSTWFTALTVDSVFSLNIGAIGWRKNSCWWWRIGEQIWINTVGASGTHLISDSQTLFHKLTEVRRQLFIKKKWDNEIFLTPYLIGSVF